MKKIIATIVTCMIALASMFPTTATAAPRYKYVKSDGATYAIGKGSGKKTVAVLVKAPAKKNVTIPKSVKHNGKKYDVVQIWDGAISRNTRRIDIRARLTDGCECDAVFDRLNLTIIVHNSKDFKWLHTYCAGRVTLNK